MSHGAGQPPPRKPAAPAEIARATPWGRVLGALLLAYLVGIGTALVVRQTGGWLDGADWEHVVLAFAQSTVSPTLDPLFYALPFLGTNYTLLPFVALGVGWLWYRGEHVTATHLAIVQLGSLLLNVSLKFSLLRPRPTLYDPRGQHGMSAYPSGHSIAVTSVLLTIAWLIHRHGKGTWGYWVVAIVFIANSYSRVYLGVHWPTDVIGGTLVGATWLILTIAIFRPLHTRFGEP